MSGENLANGTDYEYDSVLHTLTIKSNKPVTISMKSGVSKVKQDQIVVADGITANVTLNGVDIEIDIDKATKYRKDNGAIEILGSGVLNLTIQGKNSLYGSCGIYVPVGATLGDQRRL